MQQALEVIEERSDSLSAASEAEEEASSSSVLPAQAGVLPAGQCYCRFDYDWSEWSLSDAACKAALYQRSTDPLSGLARVWLDDYYSYKPSEGGVLLPPNADQISAFLYSDCTPAPPCSCIALGGRDKSQACFSEIQIYAADPSRRVPEGVLQVRRCYMQIMANIAVLLHLHILTGTHFMWPLQDAVADGHEHTSEIRSWIQSAFPAGSCDLYQGEPYTFAPLRQQQSAWIEAWNQATRTASQPTFLIQLTLSALCALAVLASLLIIKKLAQPSSELRHAILDQP